MIELGRDYVEISHEIKTTSCKGRARFEVERKFLVTRPYAKHPAHLYTPIPPRLNFAHLFLRFLRNISRDVISSATLKSNLLLKVLL